MLDNGQSLVVEGCKVTLLIAERSFKSISGMVELVSGIAPMGSAQTAEFEWVSLRGLLHLWTCKRLKINWKGLQTLLARFCMLKLLVEHEMVLLPGHPRNLLLILFVMLVIKEILLLVLKILHILAVYLLLLVNLLLVNIIQLLNLLLVLKYLLLLVLKNLLLLNLLLF
jgi:hypothetical protein